MPITPSGIAMLVSAVQEESAKEPIIVTLSPSGETGGITMSVSVQVPIPLTEQVPSPFEVNSSPSLYVGAIYYGQTVGTPST